MKKLLTGALVLALLPLWFSHAELYAVCLSGYVRDANGIPVGNVDLDFIDATTGVKLITPRDNTDAQGFYNVCVLPGIYHVTFAPRRGSHLIATEIRGVDLSDNQSRERNVILQTGIVISGRVTDSLLAPIGDIDLDLDSIGGGRVYTGDDNSSPLDGTFWVVVPPGNYRLRFDPLPGTGWRGLQIDSILIINDTTLDATMHRGYTLSGSVYDQLTNGLADVDIELKVESTGEKIFVADNTTDTSGRYEIVVPPGKFELRFVPPLGSHWVGVGIPGFQIDGDSSWSATLESGIIVSVTVTDSSQNPLRDVDLDFNIPGTSTKLFTPHDKTNSNGFTIEAVPAGIYDLELDPPVGAPYDRLTITALNVQRDTSIQCSLAEVNRFRVQGHVRSPDGVGLGGIELEIHSSVTGAKLFLPNNLTDDSGNFDIAVPSGQIDLYIIPPVESRFVPSLQENLLISADTLLPSYELPLGVLTVFRVLHSDSSAIADVTIVASIHGQPAPVFTPRNVTAINGEAACVLVPGHYDLAARPPAGIDLGAKSIQDVQIQKDTTIVFILTTSTTETESELVAVLHQNYPNPFSTETLIPYELLEPTRAAVKIYTVAGELVQTLVDGDHVAGAHEVSWTGKNEAGQDVAEGVYVCLLYTPQRTEMRKIVLIR